MSTNPPRPEMWPGSFWSQPIDDAPVDTERTAAYHERDADVSLGDRYDDGRDWNVPWHDSGRTQRVWQPKRGLFSWGPKGFEWFPGEDVPVPYAPRILGGPGWFAARDTDAQLFVIAPPYYYEVSSFGPGFLHPWRAGSIARWDLRVPWEAQRNDSGHPVGIAGSRIPLVPTVAAFEHFYNGHIPFAQQMFCEPDIVAAGAYRLPARATDGRGGADAILLEGDRLRLSTQAWLELSHQARTPHDHVELAALARHGVYVGDIGGTSGGDGIRCAQDRRIALTLRLRRRHFEVMAA